MARLGLIFFCALFVAVHIAALGKVTEEANKLPRNEESAYVIPGPVLKLTALEFDGLASDFLFLKSLVFLGSTQERREKVKIKDFEWKWLYRALDATSNLDPYFRDPYYFGTANLTWGGGLLNEANILLEKGCAYRTWDSLLAFYLGFNYYYFLENDQKASEWLMEASRRPDASPLYASLAVKLSYKKKRLENAVAFQEYMLEHTEEPTLRKEYETRLHALQALLYLEKAARDYKRRFGSLPKDIFDLVARHVIKQIPSDPYGGYYFIDAFGTVKTSSEMQLMPYRRLNRSSSQTTQHQFGHFN